MKNTSRARAKCSSTPGSSTRSPFGAWSLAASSDPAQTVADPVTTPIVRDASFTLLRSAR
jgi:hypothetical protein